MKIPAQVIRLRLGVFVAPKISCKGALSGRKYSLPRTMNRSVCPLSVTTRTSAPGVSLFRSQKTTGLSDEEKAELDHYMWLEHVMRMAKIRARRMMNS